MVRGLGAGSQGQFTTIPLSLALSCHSKGTSFREFHFSLAFYPNLGDFCAVTLSLARNEE